MVGMRLFIGGYAQGKREYVSGRFPEGQILEATETSMVLRQLAEGREISFCSPLILADFHLTVRVLLQAGWEKETIWQQLENLAQCVEELLIISDDIGNGIVPLEKEERIWREENGRILCRIAQEAAEVERIVCGIAQKIK